MPKFININDRLPDKDGMYFCKIEGRREIMNRRRISEYEGRYKDVFWLDESTEETKEPELKSAQVGSFFGIEKLKTILSESKKNSSPKEPYEFQRH